MTEETSQRNRAPEFPVPPGFKPPEGKDENNPGEFEAVSTFRLKPDGKTLCLIQMGEHKFDYDEDTKEAKDQAPGYKEMGRGIVNAVDEANPGKYAGY